MKHFEKFADTTEALAATTAAVEGKLSKSLKKLLKKQCEEIHEQLAVADAKLGNAIKDKLSIPCVSNTAIQELMRCIRSQSESLLGDALKKEMTAMALGLAHSLSRFLFFFCFKKFNFQFHSIIFVYLYTKTALQFYSIILYYQNIL